MVLTSRMRVQHPPVVFVRAMTLEPQGLVVVVVYWLRVEICCFRAPIQNAVVYLVPQLDRPAVPLADVQGASCLIGFDSNLPQAFVLLESFKPAALGCAFSFDFSNQFHEISVACLVILYPVLEGCALLFQIDDLLLDDWVDRIEK